MYLVLIETSGNQNYIFSTNKLKENMGASELTYRAGTQWVLEAIADLNDKKELEIWKDSKRLRKLLRDKETNPPIETSNKTVEILTAASGKALLLTHTEETAQAIIKSVTRKALIDAPGLTLSGVYETITDWDTEGSLATAIGKVHQKFEAARSQLPSPANRFLRLPIVADCSASGLPASKLEDISPAQRTEGRKAKPISSMSAVKRRISLKAKDRLTNLDERLASQIDRLLNEEDSSEQRSWLAVVHADGNGLGQIFLSFDDYIGEDKSNPNYIRAYREFSLALDECTEAAFVKALDVFPEETNDKNKSMAPIVPLIIGGDDLTVVCDGRYALEFTRVFLQEFEKQTKNHDSIAKVARQAFGVNHLSACAGIAIIKRHFPFSVAYDLAESLIKSAKDVKQKITCTVTDTIRPNTPFPCSAIDFHILYDTSGVDLKDIREKLMPQLNIKLYNTPYIVSEMDSLKDAVGFEWAQLHPWQQLSDRIEWLNSGKSAHQKLAPISSSQNHAFRSALFLGKKAADAQYRLIQQRYDIGKFAESDQSLFHRCAEDIYATSFLDALEAKDFFDNAQSDSNNSNRQQTGA